MEGHGISASMGRVCTPDRPDSPAYVDELKAVGVAAGLDRVGVTHADPFDDTRGVLERRKAAGLHGGMQFTYRNPARSTDPARALRGARTLIVGAYAYPTDTDSGDALAGRGPLGRVARYATADHYASLRVGLQAMATRLEVDGWSARVLADDNALVDRAAAQRAGLGWYGKNANLLLAGSGSWFVLGSVLTDAELPNETDGVADGCGPCSRCLDHCPTGAIVSPGVVDARRCLAWLVQAEGVFPVAFRIALGDRLYGCDTCQEVCPPSIRSTVPSRSGRSSHAGEWSRVELRARPARAGGGGASHTGTWVPVLELLAGSDGELLDRFGRWYIPRREARYLRRNALLVLANTASLPAEPPVVAAIGQALGDADPIVRAHAVWAARRLGLDPMLAVLVDEPDPLVQAELVGDVARRADTPDAR
jgi:epoxyqueuosine reductase